MKRIGLILLAYFFTLSLVAQINEKHNAIRIGDVIIKQQVDYKSPGDVGSNLVWDFSELTTINDEYTLEYIEPALLGDSLYIMGDSTFVEKKTKYNELVVGIEHNTMYYYQQKDGKLTLFGHENPSIKLHYSQAMVEMTYPFSVGQVVNTEYSSGGLYSGTVELTAKGRRETSIDAFGKMIIPSGDTLNPVIRVKILQTIDESATSPATELLTHRWYTKGYRYPIFETVKSTNVADSTELFSTAFYFPPQEHLYLDTDPENLALLDRLWNIEHLFEGDAMFKSEFSDTTLNTEKSYSIHPNPVQSVLNIDYTMQESGSVNMILYGMDGRVIKNLYKVNQEKGLHTEAIDCSALFAGTYLLKMVIGKKVVNEKVMKK